MGVKDLFKCLRSRGLSEQIMYSEQFKGQCIAVDVYNLFHINMYHGHLAALKDVSDPMMEPPSDYSDPFEPTSYLINKRARLSETVKSIISSFIIPLLRKDIFPIFVFDGDIRQTKTTEVNKRSDVKSSSFEKFFDERMEILTINDPVCRAVKISNLHNKLKYCYRVSSVDIDIFKNILKELGFEPLTAKYDGEELCCSLVHANIATLVYSRDSDCLMYGIPNLVTSTHCLKWGTMKGHILSSVLQCLGNQHRDPFMISGPMRVIFSATRKSSKGDRTIVKCEGFMFEQNGKRLIVRTPLGYQDRVTIRNNSLGYCEITVGHDDCPPFKIEGLINPISETGHTNSVTSKTIRIHGSILFSISETVQVNVVTNVSIDHIDVRTEMSFRSFKDYCIMLGTDFNSRIPGIGMVKALKLIDQYGLVSNVARYKPNLDYSILDYHVVDSIFTPKNYTDLIKEGKLATELTPSGETRLISKYRLSAESEAITTTYDKRTDDIEFMELDQSHSIVTGNNDLIYQANMATHQDCEIETLSIQQLMAKMST